VAHIIGDALIAGITQAQGSKADPTLWYLTRMFAVSSYVALSLTVVFGMLRGIARTSRERLSWVVDEVHQFVALLTGLLVLGHLITLVFDPFLPFTVLNLLVPEQEPYRQLATALGVFALYGVAIVLFSSWVRRALPYGFWRTLHGLSFVAYVLVTLHGWLAGSDTHELWMSALYAASTGVVVFLLFMRLIARRPTGQAVTTPSRG
jgi:methionine sulfoxide reductase heme-binding subunit